LDARDPRTVFLASVGDTPLARMNGESDRKEVGSGDVGRRLSATAVTRLPGNEAMILSPRK